MSVSILTRRASLSLGGTRDPVTPSSIISGSPPTAEATTGRPAAIASIAVSPNGSGQARYDRECAVLPGAEHVIMRDILKR